MQFFRNLRLAVRLAIAFGTLSAGLLLVGGAAVREMGSLEADTNEIAEHDMRANALAGSLSERAAAIGHHVAQHLYVKDGDLEAQDELQQRVEALAAANDRDGKTLTALLAGTSAADDMRTFTAARAEYVASWKRALERSRRETVDGVGPRRLARAVRGQGRARRRRRRRSGACARGRHRQGRRGHRRRREGGSGRAASD